MDKFKSLEAPVKLKILVTIVERVKAQFYADILEGFDCNNSSILYGIGTAPKDIKSLLGLANSDKAIIVSFVREDRINDILQAYEDKYFKTRHGKGLAFTIPLTDMVGALAYQFLSFKEEL
jgi:hypothetical protein